MTLENLIPPFKVGERVKIHYRYFEWKCPACRCNIWANRSPEEGTGTIISVPNPFIVTCIVCGFHMPSLEGWLPCAIDKNPGKWKAHKGLIPYTLLERIEREDD